MPIAWPPVGAAYQDSPGEQKRTKTTPCVWRNKGRGSDQQTGYGTRQNPTPLSVIATVCQAPFGVFYVKIITKPCNSHRKTSSLLLSNTRGSRGFSKELIQGHLVGKEVDESGYPELTSPFVRNFSVSQWAAFWWLSLKGHSACSRVSVSHCSPWCWLLSCVHSWPPATREGGSEVRLS